MAPVTLDNFDNIQELVLMSIGTNKGSWWADPAFGSDLYLLRLNGKVNQNTAGEVQRVILDSLQWLVTDGLVTSVACETSVFSKTRIDWVVTVEVNNEKQAIEGVYGI